MQDTYQKILDSTEEHKLKVYRQVLSSLRGVNYSKAHWIALENGYEDGRSIVWALGDLNEYKFIDNGKVKKYKFIDSDGRGRKRWRITEEGRIFLEYLER